MQELEGVDPEEFLAAGQEPLLKLEIWVVDEWINLCALGDPAKNYVQSISISLGGAGMTPHPVAGQWSALLSNENSIFHPKHPDSDYTDYLKAGRKVRISVGAKYDGTDYYWKRIIGYMDIPKFSSKTFEVNISGLDYTKLLTDMVFKKTAVPPDNYWGAVETKDSAPTTQLGDELYVPDGGDAAADPGEANNVLNWEVIGNGGTAITSELDIGLFSDYEIEYISDPADPPAIGRVEYEGVCDVVAGTEYHVTFKYARTAGDAWFSFILWDDMAQVGGIGPLKPAANDVFYTASFSFTAEADATLDLRLPCRIKEGDSPTTWRIDQISIKPVLEHIVHSYQMPEACNGVHYVELDEGAGFLPVWPGRKKDGEVGWFYDSVLQQFYFAEGKNVDAGTANLKIYYYTQQVPEEVVADILVTVGLYGNQGDALTAMGDPDTGVTIDQVWFEAGSPLLSAIKLLCERCDYRFYFTFDGVPVFATFPTAKAPGSEDLVFLKNHITDVEYYEEWKEIKNRIVIEGLKQALPEGADEAVPSELKGTAYNQPLIDEYGERTLSIKNHLFQDQDAIDDMCDTLLARYEDPNWYFDFVTPYNPAPLEIWDTIKAEMRLSPAISVNLRGIIRDIKIDKYNMTYKCVYTL